MRARQLPPMLVAVALLAAIQPPAGAQTPAGTAFKYQGRLTDGGSPANGDYDFEFILYDSLGVQVGSAVSVDDHLVVNGLFTVVLNASAEFGPTAFNGEARWLEIGVRPGAQSDPAPYTYLDPRQELTPAPYALYAAMAGGPGDGHSLDAADGDPVDALYVNDEGNVGIGTTSPGELLSLERVGQSGDAPKLELRGYYNGSGSGAYVRLAKSRGSAIGDYRPTSSGDVLAAIDVHGVASDNESKKAIRIHFKQDGAASTYVPGKIQFATSSGSAPSTPHMTIDKDGEVGIGLEAPAEKLQVGGVIHSTTGGFKFPDGTVQTTAGGGGDITAVYADNGLTGGATSGDAHLSVGAGDGIDVSADAVAVDVTDFAGNGLGEASNNLRVNAGTGLELSSDAVGLTSAYSSGSAYDSRFVNEGQASSITSAMIVNNSITQSDIATDGVGSGEIAAGAVGSSEIATDGVGSGEIAAGAVGSSEIATDGVGSGEIAAGAVGSSEIAVNAVGSSEIAANAVGSSEIASHSVDDSDMGFMRWGEWWALHNDTIFEASGKVKVYLVYGSDHIHIKNLGGGLIVGYAAHKNTTTSNIARLSVSSGSTISFDTHFYADISINIVDSGWSFFFKGISRGQSDGAIIGGYYSYFDSSPLP